MGLHALILTCLLAPLPAAFEAEEPVDVGTRLQLFIDDYVIARSRGLNRTLHHPKKRGEPVLKPEMPWEFDALLLQGLVLYDEQEHLFKLYYTALDVVQEPKYDETQDVLLAISKDGITWERPNLGLVEFEGSRDNNIVYWMPRQRPPERHWWGYHTVFKDLHDPDPARRYKFIGWGGKPGGPFGVELMFSPDGLHFTECPKHPVLTTGDAGSQTVGWDDRIGQYVLYTRANDEKGRRIVAYSTSPDFIEWTPPKVILRMREDDQPGLEFYQMPVAKHEGMYFGMLWVLRTGVEGHPIEAELAFSRDGVEWQRVGDGATFLPVGAKGSFEETMVLPAAPMWVGDEVRIYYGACNLPHDLTMAATAKNLTGGIGLATLRRDGFVSMDAGAQEGSLLTKPFVVAGERLVVNANAQGGSVEVSVRDASGRAIPGFSRSDCKPLRGDSTRHEVKWRGQDLSSLKGRTIRLRFHAKGASLYSFQFQ
jgi:hypothetical protein